MKKEQRSINFENVDVVKILLKSLSSRKEFNEVIGVSMEILREKYDLDAGAMFLFNPSMDNLNLEFQFGLSAIFINKIIIEGIDKIKFKGFNIFPNSEEVYIQKNIVFSNILRLSISEKKHSFSLIIISLKINNLKKGYIWLIKKEPIEISDDEIIEMKEISEILSVTIEKSQVYRELHKTIEQLEKLLNVQNSVLIDLERTNIVKRTLNEINNIFNPDHVEIVLKKEDHFEIIGKKQNITIINQDDEKFYQNQKVCQILEDKKDFIIFDDTETSFIKFPFENLTSIRSCVILPIFIEKKLEGFLLIGKKQANSFIKEDIPLYTAFPYLISQAMFIAKLHDNMLKLQTQLFHAQKMESIGILAGGISHDFNNALSGLMGAADLIELSVGPDSNLVKYISIIQRSAKRMANWTKQLLAYARGGIYRKISLNLNELLIKALNIVQINFNSKIALHISMDPNMEYIEADSDSIVQVITNLLLNSSEAISDEGDIFVSTDLILKESRIPHEKKLDLNKRYCRLIVKDTGCGMDSKVLGKVFDPFYTTKFQGRGLGLSAVYGIIENLEGKIFFESEVNSGTSAEVYLPLSEKQNIKKKEIKKNTSKAFALIMSNFEIIQPSIYKTLAINGINIIETTELNVSIRILKGKIPIRFILIDNIYTLNVLENILDIIRKIRINTKIIIIDDEKLEKRDYIKLKDKNTVFISKPQNSLDLQDKILKNINRNDS